MRCGKVFMFPPQFSSHHVATRTNALWQRARKCSATCRSQGSQPARMRCGKDAQMADYFDFLKSQPARMRCGKVMNPGIADGTEEVATRTNALWQRARRKSAYSDETSQPARMRCGKGCFSVIMTFGSAVATRTNALWQRTAI